MTACVQKHFCVCKLTIYNDILCIWKCIPYFFLIKKMWLDRTLSFVWIVHVQFLTFGESKYAFSAQVLLFSFFNSLAYEFLKHLFLHLEWMFYITKAQGSHSEFTELSKIICIALMSINKLLSVFECLVKSLSVLALYSMLSRTQVNCVQ